MGMLEGLGHEINLFTLRRPVNEPTCKFLKRFKKSLLLGSFLLVLGNSKNYSFLPSRHFVSACSACVLRRHFFTAYTAGITIFSAHSACVKCFDSFRKLGKSRLLPKRIKLFWIGTYYPIHSMLSWFFL